MFKPVWDSNYCLRAHQHYLWDTYEDKYNNIFLEEYNSDAIGDAKI